MHNDSNPEEIRRRYRELPSIDALLADPAIERLIVQEGREPLLAAARAELDEARARIAAGGHAPADWPAAIRRRLVASLAPSLQPVINATGVVIHTNLGRAPLSEAALDAMRRVASGYSNLEFDLDEGRRGSRHHHAARRLATLVDAEAALIVNNTAAALLLALAALAHGRAAVVSRAHLVEIGGGFRIPDIIRRSGAELVEVGTTNRTYLEDYVNATDERAALYLRMHTSNFRIEGFVHQPPLEDLVGAARARGLLVVDDVGSGALLDTSDYGLAREPMVQVSVAAGADLVTFSGDKLLGGPQAGCIVGRAVVVERLRGHPLARALRVDKATLAALEATLLAYERGRATDEIPVWQMIAAPERVLHARARAWAATLGQAGIEVEILPGRSPVGGGSLPGEGLPTWLVALPHPHPTTLATALRAHRPPIVARIEDGALRFDPRTVLPDQDVTLLDGIAATHSSTK